MKLFIYLVVFFILLSGTTANNVVDSLIRDSCKKASRNHEPSYYNLCILSIKENPESQKARNIDDLIVVEVKNAMLNMTNAKGLLESFMKPGINEPKVSKLREKLMRDCQKLYSEGNVSLTKALKYIKIRDYKKVSTSIADARAAPRLCEMKFYDDNLYHHRSQVMEENDFIYHLTDIAYDFNYDSHLATPTV